MTDSPGIVDQLREVHGLLKKGWTQNAFARDKSGDKVPSRSGLGVCWCITGAVRRAVDAGMDVSAIHRMIYQSIKNTGFESSYSCQENIITEFNDAEGRTQEEVLAVIDDTIDDALKAHQGGLT